MSSFDNSTNLNGNIQVVDDRLIIRFAFNKIRFNQIKSLKEACYDKANKCWWLPLDHLERLEKLKSFSPEKINYQFDRNELLTKIKDLTVKREQAKGRIIANPFSVISEDYELAQTTLVFYLAENSIGVWVRLRRKSRGKSELEALPGVVYLNRDKAYAFPVEILNSYLRQLRNSKKDFAVDADLSKQLKESAELRAKILAGTYAATWTELRQALLVPYIKIVSNRNGVVSFGLFEWTTEQLRGVLPDGNFTARKLKSKSFDVTDLVELLENSARSGINVFLDHAVSSYLTNHLAKLVLNNNPGIRTVPYAYIVTKKPELSFVVSNRSQVELLINKSAAVLGERLKEELTSLGFVPNLLTFNVWAESYSICETKLPKALEYIRQQVADCSTTITVTSRFAAFLEDLEQRAAWLERQAYYTKLTDCSLVDFDKELAHKLFAHQRVGVAWLLEVEEALLGDDMGLGKTLTVLAAFEQLRRQNKIDFVIVICPCSLVTNWQREAQSWFDDLKLATLPEGAAAQKKFLANFTPRLHAAGLVVNFETFRLARIYPELVRLVEHTNALLVVDESQRVKNPQSQAFKALTCLAVKCRRRILLSGTPMPNDLSDIWAQMFLLDQGKRLGTNYYEWLSTVAELGNKWSDYAVKCYLPDQVEKVKRRVHEVLLRRRKEQVLDLPEKLFSYRDLELSGSQLERYEEVRKELLLRVGSLSGEQYLKDITSVLEEFLRAVQIASNPRLVDPSWTGEPVKFLELDEIVKEVVEGQEGKLVIWTNFVGNIKELQERYKKYGSAAIYGQVKSSQRTAVIEDFQSLSRNSAKVLIAIPAAGGVGITLTAARTAVYLDKTWNAEHWLQSIDRVHRIGQTGSVSIISLTACLIDILIAKNLKTKFLAQKNLLEHDSEFASAAIPSRAELLHALGH